VGAVDERPAEAGLTRYRDKRDFDRTPEPAGAAPVPAATGAPRFVVQRHRARRLHYDFRLEIDGVLVSWAVPKGVTLDPQVRHLAVHVEDHPIVIPSGGYGAGDVIVWDRGTWELHGATDARAAVEAGELHADLRGEKLRGRVVLVRTGARGRDKDEWLLLHKRDDAAVEGWDPEDHPTSVLSGLTNDEVAAAPARMWTAAGERRLDAPVREFAAPTDDELAALAALGTRGTWTFQGRDVTLTNLDKVLFPARDGEPVTKRELVGYAARIAPTMLPYLLDRPLNLQRFPDGADRPGFWQKQVPDHTPEWIPRWAHAAPDDDEVEGTEYLLADSPPVLVWLANHGAIELHPWTSRVEDVDRPTYALVDIDPGPGTAWSEVVRLAQLHETALDHLGVRGYPKVTGRRGIQVWIPIVPGPSFAETRAWVETLSRTIGRVVPDLVSWSWETAGREGRARLDYTQNAVHKTLVAPYSPRPAAGAPVSVPIDWDELDDPDLRPDRWTIRTVLDRLADRGDPFHAILTQRQVLPALRVSPADP
jgi:bifunctional non-homologous end joining protein LigD